MFYNNQDNIEKKKYETDLKVIGSLSNLFSNSNVPYLYYRIAEKIFCNSFNAKDLSRGDVALDAYKNGLGIGLKTFLQGNSKSFQKVAEFNKDRELYEKLSSTKLIKTISDLRNKRIKFTENLYNIERSVYHCVVRDENVFKLYEESMDYIDIVNIKNIKKKKSTIIFDDDKHEYSFNLTKSTLTKRFITTLVSHEFNVDILESPLDDIKNCFREISHSYISTSHILDTVYLPLYGKNKKVYSNSGLNQWNANGRVRNPDEVYIPIPVSVHRKAPLFFPDRDSPFNLKLPTGDILQVKVCQSSNKALMSYHNKELGKWILRDVLSLIEGELLTYEKLQILGIDSVRIDKIDSMNYEINFASLDSFENYIEGN